MANPTTQLELEMSRELDNRTETDTLRRAQFRMHTLIAAWYDDDKIDFGPFFERLYQEAMLPYRPK